MSVGSTMVKNQSCKREQVRAQCEKLFEGLSAWRAGKRGVFSVEGRRTAARIKVNSAWVNRIERALFYSIVAADGSIGEVKEL